MKNIIKTIFEQIKRWFEKTPKKQLFIIPKGRKKDLIQQGFILNVEMYELLGETIQYGQVGNIQGDFFKKGRLKLKKGDNWSETLNTNNFTIKIEKI